MASLVPAFSVLALVDLEETCWEGAVPEGQQREVFQIGLCKLDLRTGERHDRLSLYVSLERSTVSPFCTELTGVTSAAIRKHGRPLAEVCRRIVKLGYRRHPWGSYGDDRPSLRRDCELKGAEFPLNGTHVDLGALAQLALNHGSGMRIGQTAAMERLGVAREEGEHDGGVDAWNLAALAPRLLRLPFERVRDLAPPRGSP